MSAIRKIGFGGGCHWCTEAVFQHVDGVANVEQGWIASKAPNDSFSEAVIVHYDEEVVSLTQLVRIHVHTHSSTSLHSMRGKYRSAIYYFVQADEKLITKALLAVSENFSDKLITEVLPFVDFKLNEETYHNYYLKNPEKAFCQRYIVPKLEKVKDLG